MKNLLKKHSLIASFAIVIFLFLFTRLPLFIWAPFPYLFPDTFEYFYHTNLMKNGSLPDFGNLPQGYSIFIYIIKLVSDKTFTILVLQNLIILAVTLTLIKSIHDLSKKLSLISALVISFFLMDSEIVFYDFSLQNESLYFASLVLFASFIISVTANPNKFQSWILLSLSFLPPALIRSNGIVIYLFIIPLILYLLINKKALRFYVFLLLPFILGNLFWSVYNYKTTNVFMFGNPKRYTYVVDNVLTKNNQNTTVESNNYSIKKALFQYYFKIAQQNANLFYQVVPINFEKNIKVQDKYYNQRYNTIFGDVKVDTSLLKDVYGEYYCYPDTTQWKYEGLFNEAKSNELHSSFGILIGKVWLKIYERYYLFHNLFIRNVIFPLLLLWLFYKVSILLVKERMKNSYTLLIFILAGFQLLSHLTVAVMHDNFLGRYVDVSNFLFYLVPLLYLKKCDSLKQIYKKLSICLTEKP